MKIVSHWIYSLNRGVQKHSAISNQGVKIGESKLNISFWSRSIYLKQQSPRFCPVSSIFLVSILGSQPSPRPHNSFTAPHTHCCSVFFWHFPRTPWTGAKINNLTCSMSLGPLQVTFGWKCGNGKGQRHYQFNLWFAMTTHQDHVMAWLPFCLSRGLWNCCTINLEMSPRRVILTTLNLIGTFCTAHSMYFLCCPMPKRVLQMKNFGEVTIHVYCPIEMGFLGLPKL